MLLHEVVYWLIAGILNVRADRALQMPEKQEIGELKLNFIKLSKKAGIYRRAIIAIAPLLVGIAVIWLIAVNVFTIKDVTATMQTGNPEDVLAGVRLLLGAPDFWLWFYLTFTISNTMFPTIDKDLQGWRTIGGVTLVVIIALFIVGSSSQFLDDFALSMVDFLSSLVNVLILIIGFNIFMTMILGTVESLIERVTGHSATFKNGKMITMTRVEMLELKEREQKRAIRARRRQEKQFSGPPSIYHFPLSIPGPPGDEPVTQGATAVIGVDEDKSETATPKFPSSTQPDFVINPKVGDSESPTDADDTQEKSKPDLPTRPRPNLLGSGDEDTKPADEEEDKKQPAVAFRKPSTSASTIVKDDDDEADVKPKSPFKRDKSAPVPQPKPDASTRPAFGEKAISTDEQPKVTKLPTSPSDEKTLPFGNRLPKPETLDKKSEDKEAASAKSDKPSRFGIRPSPFSKPDVDEETEANKDTREDKSAQSPFRSQSKTFGNKDANSKTKDESDKSKSRNPSRFGVRPSPFAKPKTDSSKDDRGKESTSSSSRFGIRAFGDKQDDEGKGETPITASKPLPFAKTEDDSDDTDNPRSLLSGLGKPRSTAPKASIFNKSNAEKRPAFTLDDDDSDDDWLDDLSDRFDDDLEYEDIDDEYDYEDDEDYIDYDDD